MILPGLFFKARDKNKATGGRTFHTQPVFPHSSRFWLRNGKLLLKQVEGMTTQHTNTRGRTNCGDKKNTPLFPEGHHTWYCTAGVKSTPCLIGTSLDGSAPESPLAGPFSNPEPRLPWGQPVICKCQAGILGTHVMQEGNENMVPGKTYDESFTLQWHATEPGRAFVIN